MIMSHYAVSDPNDLEIAQESQPLHIKDIADKLGVDSEVLEYYGKVKAKLPLDLIDEKKVEESEDVDAEFVFEGKIDKD